MKWGLVIANRAKRRQRRLSIEEREQIDAALAEICDNPLSGDTKFLRGSAVPFGAVPVTGASSSNWIGKSGLSSSMTSPEEDRTRIESHGDPGLRPVALYRASATEPRSRPSGSRSLSRGAQALWIDAKSNYIIARPPPRLKATRFARGFRPALTRAAERA